MYIVKFDFLKHIEKKIIAKKDFHQQLALWRFEQEKIVFTNGCFDILHAGHLQYLAQARSLGTKLVIGLNSDASVKRLKGNHRPINDDVTRTMRLASLEVVDAVIIFEEDTPFDAPVIEAWFGNLFRLYFGSFKTCFD